MLDESFASFFNKSALLSEGGNIFSDRRIKKSEVIPTVKHLEELTGLPLIDNLLGSTGKKDTSGDIDVVVDSNQLTKNGLIKQMVAKGIEPSNLKKTGIEVAYKAEIKNDKGESAGGHIQVDFMFHDDPDFLKFYYANNEELPYKGSHRNITLSAIAKSKNLTLSMKGLFSRETKQLITKDPDEIAKHVLGKDATSKDLTNLPSILAYLRKYYSQEELKDMLQPAEETTGMRLI
jgi:DNA polymerase/3'-5' exonuclease PolX